MAQEEVKQEGPKVLSEGRKPVDKEFLAELGKKITTALIGVMNEALRERAMTGEDTNRALALGTLHVVEAACRGACPTATRKDIDNAFGSFVREVSTTRMALGLFSAMEEVFAGASAAGGPVVCSECPKAEGCALKSVLGGTCTSSPEPATETPSEETPPEPTPES